MVTSGLMSIGVFSQASLLSVTALRAYHHSGLLVPAGINASTGYRTYHAGQLADAAVLRRLRGLDLPLPAVAEILKARDPEVTRKVLASHEETMRDRLKRTESVVAELQRAVASPTRETPARLEIHDNHHALVVRAVVFPDELPQFLGDIYPHLLEVAQQVDAVVVGEAAALYSRRIDDASGQAVTAYLPIASPVAIPASGTGAAIIELPAQSFAVLTHVGGYDSIAESYAALGAWVAFNATPLDDAIREIYRVTQTSTDDPAAYQTEICWPVGPALAH